MLYGQGVHFSFETPQLLDMFAITVLTEFSAFDSLQHYFFKLAIPHSSEKIEIYKRLAVKIFSLTPACHLPGFTHQSEPLILFGSYVLEIFLCV